ncbi:hypothetical protein CRUP_014860 [Coryphaenoides rupestris]|nr:hypothetical protein CRUP_014860 [Coryphaenoides rupestris]
MADQKWASGGPPVRPQRRGHGGSCLRWTASTGRRIRIRAAAAAPPHLCSRGGRGRSVEKLGGPGGIGFAVNLQVILGNPRAQFKRRGSQPGMQESDFLKQITKVGDLEPKANNCTRPLVLLPGASWIDGGGGLVQMRRPKALLLLLLLLLAHQCYQATRPPDSPI